MHKNNNPLETKKMLKPKHKWETGLYI